MAPPYKVGLSILVVVPCVPVISQLSLKWKICCVNSSPFLGIYSFYIVNKKIERHIKQCCCCPCDEYFLVDDVVLQRKNKDGKIKSFITGVNYISDLNNLADFMIRVWKLDKPCYLGS